PGGLKEVKYRDLMAKKPEFAVYEAIRCMMPKGPLGRQMLTKVRIYRGSEHKQAAQKPEVLVLK
ncbi:MAG: uL13 family ribosomal protein, partial [Clostridia bacterium]|nr:uL13 family ribosomal protein [Clostridia bacterium]